MLIAIPIGHEDGILKRIPWVTIVILFLCFSVHLIVEKENKNILKKIGSGVLEYQQYFMTHPYLKAELRENNFITISLQLHLSQRSTS